MFAVYYGKPYKGNKPLNDEPLETFEGAMICMEEYIKEMWDDHPTISDEYYITES